MNDVRPPPAAGQDPASEARSILETLRNLAFDATTPKRDRHYTKPHLRRTLKSHFRALEARINALAAYAPAKPGQGDAAAPEAPPAG